MFYFFLKNCTLYKFFSPTSHNGFNYSLMNESYDDEDMGVSCWWNSTMDAKKFVKENIKHHFIPSHSGLLQEVSLKIFLYQ